MSKFGCRSSTSSVGVGDVCVVLSLPFPGRAEGVLYKYLAYEITKEKRLRYVTIEYW